ncbi:DNA starvation/stationary phase protection protein Dps [soil metagenome]
MATGEKSRMFRTQVDIPAEKREPLVEMLNQSVADTLDLYSHAKQAHWNLKGREFFQLHELTDKLAAELIEVVDDLAERATSLGGYVFGTVRMAAQATALPEYPSDLIDGLDHVSALVERVGQYANRIRSAIDASDDLGDKSTADLYTEISRMIDQQLWFLEAHLQGEKE